MRTLNVGDSYQHQQRIFTVIKRTDDIVMACDGIGIWEVFEVRNRKEVNIKGYIIPAGEYPPPTSEFGEMARCHTVKENAEKSFREFIEIGQNSLNLAVCMAN